MLLTGGSAFGLGGRRRRDALARGERARLSRRRRGWCRSSPRRSSTTSRRAIRGARPGPDAGYAACASAAAGRPGAGQGRRGDRAPRSGRSSGASARRRAGDRLRRGPERARRDGGGARGRQRVRRRDRRGRRGCWRARAGRTGRRSRPPALIAAMEGPPDWTRLEERNTTLVCVMTDAALDKAACARVARMASGGVARAVDPVFSDVDGDVVFCLVVGQRRHRPLRADRRSARIAATVTAAAIRDAVSPRCAGSEQSDPSEFIFSVPMPGHLQDRGGRPAQHPLRRGGSRPASLQRHAGADRRDRQGIAAAALALRRAAGALLPARPRAPRGPGRAGHRDLGARPSPPTRPALERAGADGGGARLRRGAAAARLRRGQPARLQPALPLPGAARRRGVGERRRGGRWGAPGSPTALAFRLKLALAAGSPRSSPPARAAARPTGLVRLLGRGRRRRLRRLRAGGLRALRGGARVHGRGAGQPAGRRPERLAIAPCARPSARSRRRSSTTPTCACGPRPDSRGLGFRPVEPLRDPELDRARGEGRVARMNQRIVRPGITERRPRS